MMASPQAPESSSPADILSTRLFAVSREKLFQTFSDPTHLMHWWGPKGFRNSFHEFNFQVDGEWRFTMHGPDGTDYQIVKKFIEVESPERIVFQNQDPVHRFLMTMIFTDEEGSTRLTWRMRFESVEETEKLRDFIRTANEENFDRLEAYLADMEADNEFLLTRVFEAPQERVFHAWTDASILAHWWAPHAFTNPICELDVRPGGTYHIVMRSPEGTDYPIKGVYQEILKPERLVMSMDCSDHPADWHDQVKPDRTPEETNPAGEMIQTITFIEQGKRTTLTIRTRFQTSEIRDSFVRMGMKEGWSESLDSLAALLSANP